MYNNGGQMNFEKCQLLYRIISIGEITYMNNAVFTTGDQRFTYPTRLDSNIGNKVINTL